ncbi:hypothetical protein R3P38DRAFT_3186220 [Favolaschia claudopus]|uniref:Uncharacterized protein n=1 Tax=Favolaschia claudopus TaxID=2862362 RepID=A0AAW0C237_9AGAR
MVLIATCIYFAWSPVLARASPLFGLCCLIGGWISRFTHTLIPRVSYGAHREGLIKTIYGGRPALAPYIIPLSDDSAGSFDDEQPIFIGLNEIHDNEDENTRAATRRERRTAPFSIPRPWDREAPRLVKENIDEIVEFLENVDDIIELGRVVDGQTRKALLTSYLPPSIRKLWRELRTYGVEHSYADFRFEILHLYPEVDERRRGSFAGLVQLCQEFKGVKRDEEGRLCRFGVMFCDRTLDSGFARRVQQFVEERSVATVLLRQFGAGVDENKVQIQRKEDVIDLRDLVQLTEAISRTNVTYLVGEITASSDEEIRARDVETLAPIETLKKCGQREIGWRDLRRPMMRDSLDVFAQEAGSKIQSLEEERRKEYEIDQLRTEVQRLTETIHALDAARRDSLNEIFTWCRDENGVLWDAIKAVKKGLGERESDSTHKQSGGSQHGVGQCKIEMDLLREEIFSGFDVLRDEVRTIQVRLRNARVCGVLPQQITMEEFSEAIQFGQNEIVKVENELTRVFDKVGFIGESLRNLQEGFERQRINLDALHEEMMKESDWVHDEIRTIQTILHQARMCETVPIPFATSEVFLMNRDEGGNEASNK